MKFEIFVELKSKTRSKHQAIRFDVVGTETPENLIYHKDFAYVFPELQHLPMHRIQFADTAGCILDKRELWSDLVEQHVNSEELPYLVCKKGHVEEAKTTGATGAAGFDNPFPSDEEEEEEEGMETEETGGIDKATPKEECSLYKAQFDTYDYFPSPDAENEDSGEEGTEEEDIKDRLAPQPLQHEGCSFPSPEDSEEGEEEACKKDV